MPTVYVRRVHLKESLSEVIADPKIIEDWAFPGWDGGDVGHTWRITACKQEKACR
jgi:hypothetical protein